MPKKDEKYNVPLTISEILTLEHLSRTKIDALAKDIGSQPVMNERASALRQRAKKYDEIVTTLYLSRTRKRTKQEESIEYLTRVLGKQEILELRKKLGNRHRKRNYR